MKQGAGQFALSLDQVGRSYARTEVLSPLSLDLPTGSRLGLLGPNGAGKTTLLSMMACVLAPTRGRVVIGGRPVASQAEARVARQDIGFMPQNPASVPGFTALETVEYAAWLKGVRARGRTDAARSLLDRVGLGDVAGKRMRALSGGMVQRVHLAAALVGRPRVVLLDEPTVGLDPAQRLEFRSLVLGLDDAAVVLSTHLVEDIAAVATTVTVLDAGLVHFEGTPTELVAAARPDAPGDTEMERGYMSVLRPKLSTGGR